MYSRRIGIWSIGFCGRRKNGEPGDKTLEEKREPATNSTYISHRAGIEHGYTGGRGSLSPLYHPRPPYSINSS